MHEIDCLKASRSETISCHRFGFRRCSLSPLWPCLSSPFRHVAVLAFAILVCRRLDHALVFRDERLLPGSKRKRWRDRRLSSSSCWFVHSTNIRTWTHYRACCTHGGIADMVGWILLSPTYNNPLVCTRSQGAFGRGSHFSILKLPNLTVISSVCLLTVTDRFTANL